MNTGDSTPSDKSSAQESMQGKPKSEAVSPSSTDSRGGNSKGPEVQTGPMDSHTPNVPDTVIMLAAGKIDAASGLGVDGEPLPSTDEGENATLGARLKTILIGKPRNLQDKSVFSHISLVAFLAWVGLGADGLSSSCYGPPEAFATLGQHSYLGVFLAVAIAATVFIIAACYSHIIEAFPSGGGGYLVASKLLGRHVGVVSGCALLVDYVMTITVSIAAAGDALFGLMGPMWYQSEMKVYAEFAAIVVLIILNLRGVKESVQLLMPIFLLFLLTHIILIVGSVSLHLSAAGQVAQGIAQEVQTNYHNPDIGIFGMLTMLLFAYSLGAGTYTGLEAVSNSMPVMREPRVATAKRTMRYMAYSLAFMAGGLIIAYLLLGISTSSDKTLNLVLTEAFVEGVGFGDGHWLGTGFIFATLLSEGALLFVGAQAGFIDGPRVLANMAHDSWMPRWFANLSERLATHNGVLLIGTSALVALLCTRGNIHILVIMYSINVFLTFSLSMIGMCRHWFSLRKTNPLWLRRFILFFVGAALCLAILSVSLAEKVVMKIVREGDYSGFVTILVTSACVVLCLLIRRYYDQVGVKLRQLDAMLGHVSALAEPNMAEPDPKQPAAVILVGSYSGLGIHTMLNAIRFAPDHFKSFIFISVGVIDTGTFKGSGAVESLQLHCQETLDRYVDLARRLGMASTSYLAVGTDAVDELESTCLELARKYPKGTFFAGQLVFHKDTWIHRLLHNQTAYSLQHRLQWAGVPMVILPTRVR
jgi:amino acid transporter